jgi:hypothetical protein
MPIPKTAIPLATLKIFQTRLMFHFTKAYLAMLPKFS